MQAASFWDGACAVLVEIEIYFFFLAYNDMVLSHADFAKEMRAFH